jgi:hypothetical protein
MKGVVDTITKERRDQNLLTLTTTEKVHHDKFLYMISYQYIKQIYLDIERYERKMRDVEKQHQQIIASASFSMGKSGSSGYIDKSEVTLLWMEVVTRKDLLKQLVLLNYEPMMDLAIIDKQLLQSFFYSLNGFSWKNNYGWVGQTSNVARLEIDPFYASSSLYEGIKLAKSGEFSSDGKVENDENGRRSPSSSILRSPSSKLFTASDNNDGNYYGNATVKELSLPGNGLDGNLDNSLKTLFENCTFLNLNYNLISSHFSNFSFFTCKSLIILQLANNELTGNIDTNSFQFFTELKILDLSSNQLTGSLPTDLFATMKNLEKCNLSYNQFHGILPKSLKECIKLEELKLYHNSFSGELEEEIFLELKELKLLNLSFNQ